MDLPETSKFPVTLSDALLSGTPDQVFTGIRFNHKPSLSSETAPKTARVKPSTKDGAYNLSFEDQGKYMFQGARAVGDGQFVLIFNAEKQAFVLHRVDSIFHMNAIRMPSNTNAESLKRLFPHIEPPPGSTIQRSSAKGATAATKPAASTAAKSHESSVASRAPSQVASPAATPSEPAGQPLAPAPAPAPKAKPRESSPEESEEDYSDDGGLLVEYPGGPINSFSPPRFAAPRRFSDLQRDDEPDDDDNQARSDAAEANIEAALDMVEGHDGNDEDDEGDADHSDVDDDGIDNLRLPSPANHDHFNGQNGHINDDEEDDDMGMDIEAELERELQEAVDEESEVSEED